MRADSLQPCIFLFFCDRKLSTWRHRSRPRKAATAAPAAANLPTAAEPPEAAADASSAVTPRPQLGTPAAAASAAPSAHAAAAAASARPTLSVEGGAGLPGQTHTLHQSWAPAHAAAVAWHMLVIQARRSLLPATHAPFCCGLSLNCRMQSPSLQLLVWHSLPASAASCSSPDKCCRHPTIMSPGRSLLAGRQLHPPGC